MRAFASCEPGGVLELSEQLLMPCHRGDFATASQLRYCSEEVGWTGATEIWQYKVLPKASPG